MIFGTISPWPLPVRQCVFPGAGWCVSTECVSRHQFCTYSCRTAIVPTLFRVTNCFFILCIHHSLPVHCAICDFDSLNSLYTNCQLMHSSFISSCFVTGSAILGTRWYITVNPYADLQCHNACHRRIDRQGDRQTDNSMMAICQQYYWQTNNWTSIQTNKRICSQQINKMLRLIKETVN